MINRKKFYEELRKAPKLMFKTLNSGHVNGMEAIFNEWDSNCTVYKDVRWLAYMLATVYHECAETMQPIEEYGKGKGRPYGKKLKFSGAKYEKPDKIYYGRGFVQLTWYENYDLMGRLLGVDLLNKPELALQLNIATKIMFEGMTKGKSMRGDFTGKSLENYFNGNLEDPVNARRIINGTDKATLIAIYYKDFLKCLS